MSGWSSASPASVSCSTAAARWSRCVCLPPVSEPLPLRCWAVPPFPLPTWDWSALATGPDLVLRRVDSTWCHASLDCCSPDHGRGGPLTVSRTGSSRSHFLQR
eukprot:9476941-Pyramimonas_sp.AAC.1